MTDHRRARLVLRRKTRRDGGSASLLHRCEASASAGSAPVRRGRDENVGAHALALVFGRGHVHGRDRVLIPLAIVVRDVARDQAFTTAQLTERRSSRCSRSPRPAHDRARYRQHPAGAAGGCRLSSLPPEAREVAWSGPGDGAGGAPRRGGRLGTGARGRTDRRAAARELRAVAHGRDGRAVVIAPVTGGYVVLQPVAAQREPDSRHRGVRAGQRSLDGVTGRWAVDDGVRWP